MQDLGVVEVLDTLNDLEHDALSSTALTLTSEGEYRILWRNSPAKSWSMYSNTRKVEPRKQFRFCGLLIMISFSRTMFLWSIVFSRLISMLQHCGTSQRRYRKAFGLCLWILVFDLLDCYELSGFELDCFVDGAVGASPHLLNDLVFLRNVVDSKERRLHPFDYIICS